MLALETGYDRIEAAALQAALPNSGRDDGWRRNDLPPIPPMTPDQALQLLYLHEKSVRQSWSKPHRRRRRNESEEAYIERLRAMWTTEQEREADRAALRRVDFYELNRDDPAPDELPPPPLPALEQVTGWSKADPAKRKHNPDKALFGGWRLDDIGAKHRKAEASSVPVASGGACKAHDDRRDLARAARTPGRRRRGRSLSAVRQANEATSSDT